MDALVATDREQLSAHTTAFDTCMEPLIQRLDAAVRAGTTPADVVEFEQYIQVCRWPFRRLEYALAIDVLLAALQPGDRYLDAGCGVTPLAHVFGARGITATACDGDARVIAALNGIDTAGIYGSGVTYEYQDLVRLNFPDESFDAISCISVLEHIPPAGDRAALRELLRVLKPGGVLVLTVDYQPPDASTMCGAWRHYVSRTRELARRGEFAGVGAGVRARLDARREVIRGAARHPRSANQCFQLPHLTDDIAPLLSGLSTIACAEATRIPCEVATSVDARRLWGIEDGVFEAAGRRIVLPAAFAGRKAAPRAGVEG